MASAEHEGLLVIGAGLPRTGTLSTRAALERLIGPCYHGATAVVERTEHILLWMAFLREGRPDPVQLAEILQGYRAGVDLPFSGWWVPAGPPLLQVPGADGAPPGGQGAAHRQGPEEVVRQRLPPLRPAELGGGGAALLPVPVAGGPRRGGGLHKAGGLRHTAGQ
jgi:hypothetical protein